MKLFRCDYCGRDVIQKREMRRVAVKTVGYDRFFLVRWIEALRSQTAVELCQECTDKFNAFVGKIGGV